MQDEQLLYKSWISDPNKSMGNILGIYETDTRSVGNAFFAYANFYILLSVEWDWREVMEYLILTSKELQQSNKGAVNYNFWAASWSHSL